MNKHQYFFVLIVFSAAMLMFGHDVPVLLLFYAYGMMDLDAICRLVKRTTRCTDRHFSSFPMRAYLMVGIHWHHSTPFVPHTTTHINGAEQCRSIGSIIQMHCSTQPTRHVQIWKCGRCQCNRGSPECKCLATFVPAANQGPLSGPFGWRAAELSLHTGCQAQYAV